LEFGAFWRHIQMKRRVFSKTTPFHTFKKEKKKKREQNGVVLNDTVHLLPPITQRGRRKKFCFNLNFCRPLSRLEPTDRTQWPTTHRAPTRKPRGGAGPWQSHQWPTSRLLPMRPVQSHALGSINRTRRALVRERREQRGGKKEKNKKNRGEREEEPKEERNREERKT